MNSCPSFIVTFSSPDSNFPVLISGPFVSNNKATGLFNFSLTLLIVAIFSAFSSYPPCEKLILATFNPAFTRFVNISSLSLAGPIVPIMFVFLKTCFILYSSLSNCFLLYHVNCLFSTLFFYFLGFII